MPIYWKVEARDIEEGQTTTFDVSRYFTGNRNVYTFSPENSNVIDVEIAEGTGNLTMTGTGAGRQTLTLIATNGGGTVSVLMDVNVKRPIVTTPLDPAAPTFKAESYEPGENSWYTLNYNIRQMCSTAVWIP